MRVFWAIIAVLVLAGVGALAFSSMKASNAGRQANETRAQAETAREKALADARNAEAKAAADKLAAEKLVAEKIDAEIAANQATKSTTPPAAAPAKDAKPAEIAQAAPPTAGTIAPDAKTPPVGTTKAPPVAGTHAPGAGAAHQPAKPAAPPRPEPREEPPADPNATMPDGVPAKLGEYDVRPVRMEKKDDGSVVLDGRFPLRGAGTKEDPYRVSWELLVSAKDTFEPAAGLKKISGRVAMLHDKWVRLDGYVAFPLMMQKPTELLSMLNQWDGCCIGVPPTPYDAVEVKLAKMVTGDARFAVTGSVVGKFKVDPYVVKNPRGDWLVGMYTMSVADFTPEDIGDGAGT